MFDTQSDLLSYAHLHADVDQLFRAYLDTALMELAGKCIGDPKKYWRGVIKLRHDKLGYPDPPPTPTPTPTPTPKEPSIDALIDAMPSEDQPIEALQYLYWFEVRSDYWSRATKEDLETLSEVLPAAQRLEMLCSEARELEKRIEKIDQLKALGYGEAALPRGTISVDPLPQRGFEGLLAKVVGPAKSGES